VIGVNEMTPMLNTHPKEFTHTDWTVQQSVDLLEDLEKGRPFFLWTSLIDPHPANQVHEPYYSMYNDEEIPEPVLPDWSQDERCPWVIRNIRNGNSFWSMNENERRQMRGVYYGMVTNIDHQLAHLFGALMRQGLWDNTVVVFTTDHGEMLGDYGTCFKGTMLDPSARLPFLVRLPQRMKPKVNTRCRALVELADLLPTFCDIAGVDPPEDVTGRSILPILRGEADHIRGELHGQIDGSHLFHDGRYKYLYFADDGRELLFDKENDPLDEYDLAGEAELVEPIRRRFKAHLASEGHAHCQGGQLLNHGRTDADIDPSNVIGWMGLRSC
jgi:arylsulfatase A-like enzyme